MSQHEGHEFQIIYYGRWSCPAKVNEDGDIKVAYDKYEPEEVDESNLWCETCSAPVTGEEIGANDDWEEV